MKFKLTILFTLLALACVAHAQSVPPLAIHIDGQVYRWSLGEDEPRFTGCDLQGNRVNLWDTTLVQSSQGDWTAFMALPPGHLNAAPQATGDLWVCNMSTGDAYALSATGNSTFMISEGAFSPDGSQIVWTEVEDFSTVSSARLMLHDLKAQKTSVLVEGMPLADKCGIGIGAPRVIWGEAGIVIPYKHTDQEDPCSEVLEFGFSLYAEDGTLRHSFPVGLLRFDVFHWLSDAEPRLAFAGRIDSSDPIQLYSLDMTTGELRSEEGVIEAFRPEAGENGGHYLLTDSNSYFTYNLPHIDFPGGQEALQADADAALSPDGTLMAIVIGHTLYFADQDGLKPAAWNETYYALASDDIFNLDATLGQVEVAWTPPSYRLVPVPDSLCPETEPLELGVTAHMPYDLGDTDLRAAPSLEAALVTRIPEGEDVVVADFYNANPFGMHNEPLPVCSGGIRWREIRFAKHTGWTDELTYTPQG